MTTNELSDALERRLTPFVEQLMALTRIPGMAVGVVADGATAYARGFGVDSLDDPRPVTAETLFHMASVTKPFVATAVMQLVEEGVIALDDPVVQHLPHFTLSKPMSRTVRSSSLPTQQTRRRRICRVRRLSWQQATQQVTSLV